MYIESEGILYRGPDPDHPTEVWRYPTGGWVKFHKKEFGDVRGREIDEAAAEALKTNNPAAEHYMYYDTPPWKQPLSEAYMEAMRTPLIKAKIAERQAVLRRSKAEDSRK